MMNTNPCPDTVPRRRLTVAVTTTLAFLFVLATQGRASAQGIETRSSAVVLYGSAATCSQPAQVDWKKVRAKTPEWKTIRSEGIPAGSARYSLLISDMTKRIKRAARRVAEDEGKDCVVRKGDVSDARGVTVTDLTSDVIKKLESNADAP